VSHSYIYTMEKQLLGDKETYPDTNILQKTLKGSFGSYNLLMNTITSDEHGLNPEWRYYNDGKAWLCKVVYKKKTVFWMSVWDGFFKTAFYFTEKDYPGIYDLDIADHIKKAFAESKPVGKLIPLIIDVSEEDQVNEVLKITAYKMRIK